MHPTALIANVMMTFILNDVHNVMAESPPKLT